MRSMLFLFLTMIASTAFSFNGMAASVVHSSVKQQADVINVKNYGAKGDGIQDDADEIQQALGKVSGTIKTVVFPAGTYKISKTLRTTAIGTIMLFEKGAKLLLTSNVNGGIILLHNNCTVQGAAIEGNGQTATTLYVGYGVMLAAVSNCVVSECNFSHISGCNIFLVRSRDKGCSDCKITGNRISLPALAQSTALDGSAIMIGYSGTGYAHTNNVVSGNDIDGGNVVGHGVAIMAHGSGNKVIKNHIRNCLRYGVISYETKYEDSTLTSTSVIDNVIEDIGAAPGTQNNMGMGIYIMKAHYSIITGNRVVNALRNADNSETLGRGAISVNGAVGCKIDNNTILHSGRNGIVCVYGFDTEICNNTIDGTIDAGIYLKNTNGNIIKNNDLKNIGKLLIRGTFGSMNRPTYAQNAVLSRYKNVNTGNGIQIEGNRFYTNSANIINLAGESGAAGGGFDNKLRNISIQNNTLIGGRGKLENGVILKDAEQGVNRVSNNINKSN